MDTRGDFLKYDKQVLRFYGYWDDTDNLYGVVHDLEIYYYLADNTIEIKENLPSNSGRDSGSTFLRRMQVPKVRIFLLFDCSIIGNFHRMIHVTIKKRLYYDYKAKFSL